MDPNEKINMYQTFTELPKWLTRDFIEEALRESEKDPSLKLLDHNIVSATKPGDNFASIALRMRTTYSSKDQEVTKKYIVKVAHFEEGFKKEMMKDAALFETEINVYAKTIPEMQKLLEAANVNEEIAPPVAFFSLNPHKVVFIEDISPEFIMSETQLNFEESSIIFKKIATFHALSFFMGDGPMEEYKDGFVSLKVPHQRAFLAQNLTLFADAISKWGPEMEMIAEKMLLMRPTIFDRCLEVFQKNPKSNFNVLNHGDFHIKNILFRNQKEFPDANDSARLIDFQLAVWATPAIDLIFALYGMVGHEARERRDDLIRIYHEQFTYILKAVGYLKTPPSLLDLQVELLRNGLVEVFMVTFFMPMFYTDHKKCSAEGEVTMEQLDEMRKQVLNQPNMKPILIDLLRVFNHKGFFEV